MKQYMDISKVYDLNKSLEALEMRKIVVSYYYKQKYVNKNNKNTAIAQLCFLIVTPFFYSIQHNISWKPVYVYVG